MHDVDEELAQEEQRLAVDQPPWPPDRCGCGQQLHYSNDSLRQLIDLQVKRLGPLILVRAEGTRTWWVPRHFIALHGLRAVELDALGERCHWPEHKVT